MTGSGTFNVSAIPEYNLYDFTASGSNGNDTVSIAATYFQPWNSDLGALETAVGDGQSAFGKSFEFGLGSVAQCVLGVTYLRDVCGISIDGITGFGAITGLGTANGLVQVFGIQNFAGGDGPGQLLAEAGIINTQALITGVSEPGGRNPTAGSFHGTFDIVDPVPSDVPEPSTLTLLVSALGCRLWSCRRP